MDLTGKVCIITGATHGIGFQTAKLFAELGARVIAIGRDTSRGEELVENYKNRIIFRRCDLSNRDQLTELIQWINTNLERVDVLINNASRNSRYSVLNITLTEWDSMVELNLTAPIFLAQAVANKMIKNGIKGKIINVGAIQALYPLESSLAYVTTKGGLMSATRSIAVDLGKHGIQAITVLPGPIYNRDTVVPEDLDKRAATLLGRMGRTNEVAKLLAFLASDDNSFMTGNEIRIDGGRLISRKPDPTEITTGEI